MDKAFKSDGCSGLFMRAVHAYWRVRGQHTKSAMVRALCETHDAAYYPGGSAIARVEADATLIVAVARLGSPLLSRFMMLGISVGGCPWWPFPWRWGFRKRWPRGCGYSAK